MTRHPGKIKTAVVGVSIPIKKWRGNDYVEPDISAGFPHLISAGVAAKGGLRVGKRTTLHPRVGIGPFGPMIGVSVKREAAVPKQDTETKEETKKAAMRGMFDELEKIATGTIPPMLTAQQAAMLDMIPGGHSEDGEEKSRAVAALRTMPAWQREDAIAGTGMVPMLGSLTAGGLGGAAAGFGLGRKINMPIIGALAGLYTGGLLGAKGGHAIREKMLDKARAKYNETNPNQIPAGYDATRLTPERRAATRNVIAKTLKSAQAQAAENRFLKEQLARGETVF